jgi:hypothetical protein
MAIAEKEEIIYYELVKMEERITQKADLILNAKDEIEQILTQIKIIVENLERKSNE